LFKIRFAGIDLAKRPPKAGEEEFRKIEKGSEEEPH